MTAAEQARADVKALLPCHHAARCDELMHGADCPARYRDAIAAHVTPVYERAQASHARDEIALEWRAKMGDWIERAERAEAELAGMTAHGKIAYWRRKYQHAEADVAQLRAAIVCFITDHDVQGFAALSTLRRALAATGPKR